MTGPVLEDVLAPGLRVVFCGTGAGNKSAELGSYYAGRGNTFWKVLAAVGFTDRVLLPAEYRRLLDYGIGLTDLVKHAHGMDKDLDADDFDPVGLTERIHAVGPIVLAFTSKTAARKYLGAGEVEYGPSSATIGATRVWVLPSTSGAARSSWSIEPWRALHAAVKGHAPSGLGRAESASSPRPVPQRHVPARPQRVKTPRSAATDEPDAPLSALLQRLRRVAAEDPVVRTLSRGNPWKIVEVGTRGVVLQSMEGSDRRQRIETDMLEAAWQRLVERGRLTRKEAQFDLGKHGYRSSARLFAQLAHLPEVRVEDDTGGAKALVVGPG